MMKDQSQTAAGGRGSAWLRLLGIGAAAALLALCWAAAGAAAQPTVTAEYSGLLSDAPQSVKDRINSILSVNVGAPGSQAVQSVGWVCSGLYRSFPCRYLDVSWSGITPRNRLLEQYVITLARNQNPTARDIGAADDEFGRLLVPTQMSQSVENRRTTQQYVPMPWAGETVTVTVSGAAGSRASAVVEIPGVERPAAFTARAAADQAGATLVADPNDAELPLVMSVWRKVPGATRYEVQYTVRTRSRNSGQRLTKLSYMVRSSALSDEEGAPAQYSTYDADWRQHPNPKVRALADSDFGAGGEWIGELISLPELLAGADGWPADEPGAKAAVLAALRAGKAAVGIRVRPIAACGADYYNAHCDAAWALAAPGILAMWGKQSIISYVQFKGANAPRWIRTAAGG